MPVVIHFAFELASDFRLLADKRDVHITLRTNTDARLASIFGVAHQIIVAKAIALTTWSGWVRILGGSRQSPDNPRQLNAGFCDFANG
jgi:hypothetical protein